jgi:transcriptional regulator with XRE-family HTH domain
VVGVSASTLSLIERGRRRGSRELLVRLAAFYCTDPDVVLIAGGQLPTWIRDTLRSMPEATCAAAADRLSAYAAQQATSVADSRSTLD